MDPQKYTLASLRQDLIDNNMHVKAIIQDILAFRGTIVELENFNEAGRAKLSALRKCIERMNEWASDEGDTALYKEVDTHRQQFSRTLQAFRKANISTMLEIEKLEKQELFNTDVEGADADTDAADHSTGNTSGSTSASGVPGLRQRTAPSSSSRHSRSSLVSQQDSVTDRMMSISRHLSETTQRSAATLDTLVASSVNVEGTRDELHATAGTISQSGKLLKKYGRRECTDKVLLMFALAFFLACVVYIVQKRLF